MATQEIGKMALMLVDKPDDSNTQTKPQQRVLDEDTYLEVRYDTIRYDTIHNVIVHQVLRIGLLIGGALIGSPVSGFLKNS